MTGEPKFHVFIAREPGPLDPIGAPTAREYVARHKSLEEARAIAREKNAKLPPKSGRHAYFEEVS